MGFIAAATRKALDIRPSSRRLPASHVPQARLQMQCQGQAQKLGKCFEEGLYFWFPVDLFAMQRLMPSSWWKTIDLLATFSLVVDLCTAWYLDVDRLDLLRPDLCEMRDCCGSQHHCLAGAEVVCACSTSKRTTTTAGLRGNKGATDQTIGLSGTEPREQEKVV